MGWSGSAGGEAHGRDLRGDDFHLRRRALRPPSGDRQHPSNVLLVEASSRDENLNVGGVWVLYQNDMKLLPKSNHNPNSDPDSDPKFNPMGSDGLARPQANMLARRRDGRPQIVLLDHGLYKRISDDFRRAGDSEK